VEVFELNNRCADALGIPDVDFDGLLTEAANDARRKISEFGDKWWGVMSAGADEVEDLLYDITKQALDIEDLKSEANDARIEIARLKFDVSNAVSDTARELQQQIEQYIANKLGDSDAVFGEFQSWLSDEINKLIAESRPSLLEAVDTASSSDVQVRSNSRNTSSLMTASEGRNLHGPEDWAMEELYTNLGNAVLGFSETDLKDYLGSKNSTLEEKQRFVRTNLRDFFGEYFKVLATPGLPEVRSDDDHENAAELPHLNSRTEERQQATPFENPLVGYSQRLLGAQKKFNAEINTGQRSALGAGLQQDTSIVECTFDHEWVEFTIPIREVVEAIEPCACEIILVTLAMSAVGFFVPG